MLSGIFIVKTLFRFSRTEGSAFVMEINPQVTTPTSIVEKSMSRYFFRILNFIKIIKPADSFVFTEYGYAQSPFLIPKNNFNRQPRGLQGFNTKIFIMNRTPVCIMQYQYIISEREGLHKHRKIL